MNERIMPGLAVAVSALFLFAPAAYGQLPITTNEPHKAILGDDGRPNIWTVDLKEEGPIRFQVQANSAKVIAFLLRDGKKEITLIPANQKGVRVNTNGVSGMDIECASATATIPPGRYTILVRPTRKGNATSYKIRVLEPTFK